MTAFVKLLFSCFYSRKISCFDSCMHLWCNVNHCKTSWPQRVVTLVADKLKRQWLWEVCFGI